MRFLRRALFVCVAAAAALLVVPRLHSAQGASETPKAGGQPVEPQPLYEHLQTLMADGVMPNYRAAASACERDDREALRRALLNISELAGRLDKYAPPRNSADLEHYSRHMGEVRLQSAALSAGVEKGDRATISAGIQRISRSCQSCHEEYAPPDRRPSRDLGSPK